MDHQNKPRQLGVWGIIAIVIDVIICLILVWNFSQLLDIHASVQTAIRGSIISDNPAEFIATIKDNDVQLWMWVVNLLGILFTLSLLAGITLPALSGYRVLSVRISYLWMLACLTFLLINLLRTILAINHLFSP